MGYYLDIGDTEVSPIISRYNVDGISVEKDI